MVNVVSHFPVTLPGQLEDWASPPGRKLVPASFLPSLQLCSRFHGWAYAVLPVGAHTAPSLGWVMGPCLLLLLLLERRVCEEQVPMLVTCS